MRLTSTLIALILFTSLTAKADTTYDFTPFASYRFGGDFENELGQTVSLSDESGLGFVFAWPYDTGRQGEILLSHYDTAIDLLPELSQSLSNDLSVTYLHLGGNTKLSNSALPIYLSGGFGLTHLRPDSNNLNDETKFSMNIGLNTRFSINEVTHFTIGAKVYGTYFNTDTEIFCNAANCAIYVDGNIWVQSEVTAGIVFSF